MKSTVYIPKKCKVGFQNRNDTYSGKLGYIIYHDGKVWRKENSWENWRQKEGTPEEIENLLTEFKKRYNHLPDVSSINSLEELKEKYLWATSKFGTDVIPIEFENTPVEGFVLNKKVGGDRYSWNPRQTYTRVYDPRGFEFEITIPNLLYILENTNSIKGKGLEGKFVYGWSGKDLILVPENSPEYQDMLGFTSLQSKKVNKKDLIKGATYVSKNNEKYLYMDLSFHYPAGNILNKSKARKFFFYNLVTKSLEIRTSLEFLAELVTSDFPDDYADYVEKLESHYEYSPVVDVDKVYLQNIEEIDQVLKDNNTLFIELDQNRNYKVSTGTDSIESFFSKLNKGYSYLSIHKINIDKNVNSQFEYSSFYHNQYQIDHMKIKSMIFLLDNPSFKDIPSLKFFKVKRKLQNGKETTI